MALTSSSSTQTSIKLPSNPTTTLFSSLPTKFFSLPKKPPSISCSLIQESMAASVQSDTVVLMRPDSFGRFGKFGGKYVPETLMYALTELEAAFQSLSADQDFQVRFFVCCLVFFC
ncbi:hypothetical protein LIER_43632 [Lithospermum erythrorhizon]|uniref:Uncharacterized protein n=1 Tax=Lithospermum erythrorhizon TaxID=34254 RepID=A0AAV3QKB7_LITER